VTADTAVTPIPVADSAVADTSNVAVQPGDFDVGRGDVDSDHSVAGPSGDLARRSAESGADVQDGVVVGQSERGDQQVDGVGAADVELVEVVELPSEWEPRSAWSLRSRSSVFARSLRRSRVPLSVGGRDDRLEGDVHSAGLWLCGQERGGEERASDRDESGDGAAHAQGVVEGVGRGEADGVGCGLLPVSGQLGRHLVRPSDGVVGGVLQRPGQ
jgi:hypothetical protein